MTLPLTIEQTIAFHIAILALFAFFVVLDRSPRLRRVLRTGFIISMAAGMLYVIAMVSLNGIALQ